MPDSDAHKPPAEAAPQGENHLPYSLAAHPASPWPEQTAWPNLARVYGIIGAGWLAVMVLRFLPGQTAIVAAIALGAALLAFFAVILLPRAYRRWMAPIEISTTKDDPAARIRLIAPESQHPAIRGRLDEESRAGFEPELLRPILGIAKDRAFAWIWTLCGIAIAVGASWLNARLPGRSITPSRAFIPSFFEIALGFSAGAFFADWLLPVYLRLSPGRLEVIRYRFLGRGPARAFETFDLHRYRVCIHLRGRFMAVVPAHVPLDQIHPAGGRARPASSFGGCTISLNATPGAREFLERCAVAALAPPAPPGALPDSLDDV